MSEFDDILAFVRVVELGSLTRAAEQLGLSKSMVSRRLDRLEGALDVKLLQRSTRGIKPTEAGRKFEGRCIHILAELEHARAEVAGQDGRLSGRLRLAVPMSFGWRHLASALAAFSVEHDHLMLDVAYDDRAVDLVGEGFDAAVRIGTLLDSRLVARRLAPIRMVTVASPLYLKASSEPKTPAALAHHPCLRASMNPYGDTWRFRVGPRWVSVLPGDARYRADNGEALLEGAIAGLGVALLPTFIACEAIREGRLTPILSSFATPERSLSLLRPPGPASAKIRVLTDFLVERFGPEPYWDLS